MNLHQGETAPIGNDAIEKADAALPFAGSMVGAAVVPFPRLTLKQYASLRVQLSVWPSWSAAILRRYHVMNEAARRVLDENWQAQLAASPETRGMFEEALAVYLASLRTRWV